VCPGNVFLKRGFVLIIPRTVGANEWAVSFVHDPNVGFDVLGLGQALSTYLADMCSALIEGYIVFIVYM